MPGTHRAEAHREEIEQVKTLVAIPCMDKVDALFMTSVIGMVVEGDVEFSIVTSSLIYDARNRLSEKACAEGFDRLLWLDSDMVFDADLFTRLSARIDEGKEFVTGLYFTRKGELKPVIYNYCGLKENEQGQKIPTADSYRDYPRNSVFPIQAAGLGGCMMDVKLIKEVMKVYGCPFSPLIGFGEDLSFCKRAISLGKTLWCDSSIKLGHLALKTITEETYLNGGK